MNAPVVFIVASGDGGFTIQKGTCLHKKQTNYKNSPQKKFCSQAFVG
jgi:hypothetical protein